MSEKKTFLRKAQRTRRRKIDGEEKSEKKNGLALVLTSYGTVL